MRTFNQNELKLFESILKLRPLSLKNTLENYLNKNYEQVISTADYLFAIGDIPVALVAHLDTVFPHPPKDIYYDKIKNVMISPQGIGTDDRAGVYAIIKILKMGLRPHVIFTMDEEKGGIGADALTIDFAKPFADMKYIIELDRHGSHDCVFYDCCNHEFEDYVESFGFITDWGTFSDISYLCPQWKVAGVNLSIGYKNEHSLIETFHVSHFYNTIDKVVKMLKDISNAKHFEYIESPYRKYYTFPTEEWYSAPGHVEKCTVCGHYLPDYEMFPAKTATGGVNYYCIDCCDKRIDWCAICGEAFEINSEDYHSVLCPDCRQNIVKKGKVKV